MNPTTPTPTPGPSVDHQSYMLSAMQADLLLHQRTHAATMANIANAFTVDLRNQNAPENDAQLATASHVPFSQPWSPGTRAVGS